MSKVLVIAAHPDDESFGCLGTLLKHKEAGDKTSFLWYTPGRNQVDGARACVDFFKAKYDQLFYTDQGLDTHPLSVLIEVLEFRMPIFRPDIVYIPFIADLNADHRIISEAAMVVLRPYKYKNPPEVWMYQTPGSTELGFRPFVVDRTENINADRKRNLIKQWYPGEMINGRETISDIEVFERWPR